MRSDVRLPAAPHRAVVRRDEPDGFGIYHDLVQSSGATTFRLGDAFESMVTAHHCPGLTLFDRQLVGADHRREAAQIRRDGFTHFYLQVLRSGRMAGGAPGEERRFLPGDAILYDATLPQRTLVGEADYITVILEREVVEAIAPDARSLHGRVLSRSVAGSIGETVLSLASRVSDPAADMPSGGGRMIAGLLGQILGDPQAHQRNAADEGAIDTARLLRAELFIEAHLGRRDLDAAMVAAGIGVSRSSLYRAFESHGGIDREIIRRRLGRLKAMLLRPDEMRSIDTLAHEVGFASASHCSRVFKKSFGLPPNRLRLEFRDPDNAASKRLDVESMRAWYRYLNAAAL